MKTTLDSISLAKKKLADELRQLEQQETDLLREQADESFAQVVSILHLFGTRFDARQRSEIAALVASTVPPPKKVRKPPSDLPPKYWLPHTGETWSGRGRPPGSFKAWEGTVSHREWKARHPKEKFPKFPG